MMNSRNSNDPLAKIESPGFTEQRLLAWERLKKNADSCSSCPLNATRQKVVFGEGPIDSEMMFIGEAPGAEEDEQGLPFVGRAGQLLSKIFEAADIDRKDIFITNVVKCRPPGNRVPAIEEMLICEELLKSQIALINPSIIVCLGATPAKWLLKTSENISSIRGKWFEWKGIQIMPMFHPSYLLRNPSKKKGSPRELTWIDIQEIKKLWIAKL